MLIARLCLPCVCAHRSSSRASPSSCSTPSPAAPLIGIATRFDIPITPSPSILLFLDMLWDISLCVFKLCM
ncbi:hypothetical protein BE221DRAFT_169661 [Ostreococcus tauri]|uniref:Uncharacterized protein n=1 Tax=Ostreococcus tauri TaxID=70448 RepID=A0A1Y5I800_OSTTA|nr:hypothetical protein BE221DRAFT_169661 [Ostreococcus tauri]